MGALSQLPCFSGLPAPDLELLEAIAKPRTADAGSVIFREGEEADALFIVLAGEIAIVKDIWGGRILDTLTAGAFFGEMGVVEQTPRCASAKALTSVSLLEVRGDDLRQILTRSPSLALRVMATISRRNRQNRSLEELAWSGEAPPAIRRGQVTLVCSMTGGAGVSTAAINLAHELSKQSKTQARVAVVDGSVEFGDLALMLDLVPTGTLAGLAHETMLDAAAVRRAAITTAAGFDLFAAPLRPELGDGLTGDFFRRLLSLLRDHYDHIVIDSPKSMQDPLPALLSEADDVLYFITPTLPSLKNARLWRGLLSQMDLGLDSVRFVLNGAGGSSESTPTLELATIETSLGSPLAGVVPADMDRVATAADSGAVLCKEKPDCDVARAFSALAATLLGQSPPEQIRPPSRWRPAWLPLIRKLPRAASA